jgi:regulator of sigma E protease
MIDIIQSVLAFIVALGVLITFHEFGHYWVARRCDVKILKFSIGFGRAIYKKTFGKDNTEFVIAALPLGGYVQMLDEREGDVKEEELPRSFNYKPLWQRVAIVSAGPIFNFIFAIFAYWIIFVVGVNGLKPFIGEVAPNSISSQSGLAIGQEIKSINGIKTPTWSAVVDKLVNHTVKGDIVTLDVTDEDGIEKKVEIDLSKISIDEMAEGKLLAALGLKVIELKLPPIIGEVIAGGAAEKSGLIENDEIISVNGKAISSWGEWVRVIMKNPGEELNVSVLRSGNVTDIALVPDSKQSEGLLVSIKRFFGYKVNPPIGFINSLPVVPDGFFKPYYTVENYSLTNAFVKGVKKTWEMSVLTLRVLGKMLVAEASVKNLSGFITIADFAGKSASIGVVAFLSFMAIVSVSLGVLNLLPVPLLDGGHLMYYFVEFITGKPVSESVLIVGQQVGFVLLIGLMSIALYNDVARIFGQI